MCINWFIWDEEKLLALVIIVNELGVSYKRTDCAPKGEFTLCTLDVQRG